MGIRASALLALALVVTGGTTAGRADAQERRKAYLVIDHIEIPPGMGRDFLRSREEVIRPIHQVAVDEGRC